MEAKRLMQGWGGWNPGFIEAFNNYEMVKGKCFVAKIGRIKGKS